MYVTLQRGPIRAGYPTLGTLTVSDGWGVKFHCLTLERTDKLIPAGTYKLAWTVSPKFSRLHKLRTGQTKAISTPEVLNVPGRSGIRIHTANYERQLLGCIAPGFKFADLNKDGKIDISESTAAYDALLDSILTEVTRRPVAFTVRNK